MNDALVHVEVPQKLPYQRVVAPLIQEPSCVCDEVSGLQQS